MVHPPNLGLGGINISSGAQVVPQRLPVETSPLLRDHPSSSTNDTRTSARSQVDFNSQSIKGSKLKGTIEPLVQSVPTPHLFRPTPLRPTPVPTSTSARSKVSSSELSIHASVEPSESLTPQTLADFSSSSFANFGCQSPFHVEMGARGRAAIDSSLEAADICASSRQVSSQQARLQIRSEVLSEPFSAGDPDPYSASEAVGRVEAGGIGVNWLLNPPREGPSRAMDSTRPTGSLRAQSPQSSVLQSDGQSPSSQP